MISKNHPIIKNENTYFLDKKTITFHSEDRDIKKWSNSNFFEISLPETLHNIQSMRLVSIELNDTLPVFSKNYRNIKLSFALDSYDETKKNNYQTIMIDEGNYTPELLALTIQNLMNTKITGKNFICKYNTITKKIKEYKDVSENGIDCLLLNAEYCASGLNLENTTDIVITHKMSNEKMTQIIGRGQRPGRVGRLNVWKLFYETEIK
mgnify:CR=1 FL=1